MRGMKRRSMRRRSKHVRTNMRRSRSMRRSRRRMRNCLVSMCSINNHKDLVGELEQNRRPALGTCCDRPSVPIPFQKTLHMSCNAVKAQGNGSAQQHDMHKRHHTERQRKCTTKCTTKRSSLRVPCPNGGSAVCQKPARRFRALAGSAISRKGKRR